MREREFDIVVLLRLLFRIATYIFVLFRRQEKNPTIQSLPEEFHFRSEYKVQANFCVVTEWVPIDNAVARKEITKRNRQHIHQPTRIEVLRSL
jgi:hypothetical protein